MGDSVAPLIHERGDGFGGSGAAKSTLRSWKCAGRRGVRAGQARLPTITRVSSEGAPTRVRGHLGPMPTGLWPWLGPLLVTVFGGFLRFWHLGRPNAVVFDETYYVKDSWSILNHGYERAYARQADAKLVNGSTDILSERATFIVHPPVGKWVIALGEKVAGLDSFGWRLGVAIIGTATVFLIARVGIRLTRSILLGCLAGFLFAIDGLAVVMSRTALLDGTLAFFLLAGFACLLVDRDRVLDTAQRMVDQGRYGARLHLGMASVADRGRAVLRAGRRHQVERSALHRALRGDGRAVGRQRPPRRRRAQAGALDAAPRRLPRLRVPRRPGRRGVRDQLVGLAVHRRRLVAAMGQRPRHRVPLHPDAHCARCGTTTGR